MRKTIYDLLSYLCDFFDGDGSCSKYSFIYELLSELITWPSLAKEFCTKEGKKNLKFLGEITKNIAKFKNIFETRFKNK